MSDGDLYAEAEAARVEGYRAAFASAEFREWVAGLSLDERARAIELGLLKPMVEAQGVGAVSVDELGGADVAAVGFIYPDEADEEVMDDGLERVALEAFIAEDKFPEVRRAVLLYLAGHGTLEGWGSKFGMSRQTFHARVRRVQEILELPPMGAQKCERARAVYRASNVRKQKIDDYEKRIND